MRSPYAGVDPAKWLEVTKRLIRRFPVPADELVEIVLGSWEDIFHSRIGTRQYQIGKQIWPEPQIMGFLLHELIPLNLSAAHPNSWRRGAASSECDACYLPNEAYSFEIKTSSSRSGIFGNRSYAHVSNTATKRRQGFMLSVNFSKFAVRGPRPNVTLIRFGWLESSDWIGQRAESGQQARLTREAKAYKLVVLWEGSEK